MGSSQSVDKEIEAKRLELDRMRQQGDEEVERLRQKADKVGGAGGGRAGNYERKGPARCPPLNFV
jgi:hypothetical protein